MDTSLLNMDTVDAVKSYEADRDNKEEEFPILE